MENQPDPRKCVFQVFNEFYAFNYYDLDRPDIQPPTHEASGSSFAVGVHKDHLYIHTNRHVVADGRTILVSNRELQVNKVQAEVVRVVPSRDIATIRVPLNNLPPEVRTMAVFRYGDSLSVRAGDQIKVFGYPRGQPEMQTETTTVSGFSTSRYAMDGPAYYMQTNGAINPGNSGGPIVAQNKRTGEWEVVAMVVAGLVGADGMNFLIPSQTILGGLVQRTIGNESALIHQARFGLVCRPTQFGFKVMCVEKDSVFYGDGGSDDAIQAGDYLRTVSLTTARGRNGTKIMLSTMQFEINNMGVIKCTADSSGTADIRTLPNFELQQLEEMCMLGTNVTFTLSRWNLAGMSRSALPDPMRDAQTLQASATMVATPMRKMMLRVPYPMFEPERLNWVRWGDAMFTQNLVLTMETVLDPYHTHVCVSWCGAGSPFKPMTSSKLTMFDNSEVPDLDAFYQQVVAFMTDNTRLWALLCFGENELYVAKHMQSGRALDMPTKGTTPVAQRPAA